MLKKISVDDVRIGMHLHALCGGWVDHPFWKTKFVLRDAAEVAKLRASGVQECFIDTAKGLDVATAAAVFGAASAPTPPTAPERPPPTAAPPPDAVPIDAELGRAAEVLNRSRAVVQSLLDDARLGKALQAEECVSLVRDITESFDRQPDAFVGLARLKSHDGYSYLHSVAVCALMVALARRMGLEEQTTRDAGLAGLLHDVGKAAIPLEILNKPGRLTDAEYTVVKQHPVRGLAMLQGRAGIPEAALDVCLHHHERPDGKGYPKGLGVEGLSQVARMSAVCDVYDATTSNRPYKNGWDPAESIAQMAGWAKAGQFDPAIFRVFLDALGVYPVGSLVKMQSGRLAVVVAQNPGAVHAPCVKIFFSTRSQMPVSVETLDTASPACTDRIVSRESNEHWKFKHLDELWAGREVLAKTAAARA